jgi:hypothetical protein
MFLDDCKFRPFNSTESKNVLSRKNGQLGIVFIEQIDTNDGFS